MANFTQQLTSISTFPRSGPPPGRRLVALILVAVLVLGSIFPGFALAGEADSEGEGSTPPIEVPVAPPDFDPGGGEEVEEEVPATDEEEAAAVEPEAKVEIEMLAPEEVTSTAAAAPVEAPPPPPIAEPEPEAPAPIQQEAAEPSEPVANAEIIAPQSRSAARSAASGSAAPGAPPPAEPVQQTEAPPPSSHDGDAPSTPDSPDRDLAGANSYVVRPGDCLWRIAAAMLPAGSDAQAIAAKVQDLWNLNRDQIGDDPNLIFSGMVLRLH